MSKITMLTGVLFFICIPKLAAQLNAILLGDALNQGNDCYLVTPDLNNRFGAIWYDNAIDFSSDFEIVFDAYFGVNDEEGADGMALVFKTDATPEIGGLGGSLGYGGISPSLAVEFDTWQNLALNDPVEDHIGLMINGDSHHNSDLAIAQLSNLENGMIHEIKFSWTAASGTIVITKDCVEIITYVGDIINLALRGSSTAYFGFTGATGGFKNEQRICFKYISFVETLLDQNICLGDIIDTVDATFSGAETYNWTPVDSVSDSTSPNPIFSPIITTTYQLSIVGNCGNVYSKSFTITVQDNPMAQIPTDIITCGNAEGMGVFDLNSKDNEIKDGQDNVTVTYYATQTEANFGGTSLLSPFESNSKTVFARVENNTNTDCFITTTLNLVLNPIPEFSIESSEIVCSSDPSFTVVLDPLEENPSEIFTYDWFDPEGVFLSNNNTITVSTSGTYSITLTKTDGTNCSRTRTVFVNGSELATIRQADIIIKDISNNNTIIIDETNLGLGDYEYTLNDEFSSYQDEPFFENINGGIYTLFVRDKKGCGTVSIVISVIDYPRFFTPNDDGQNDFWQIQGISSQFQPSSDIYIFNRYGKLLKQLDPISEGWDGMSNGNMLTSDDYWFRVLLQNGRAFNGHFTLVR